MHRCSLIADWLIRSRTEGRTDTAGRLDCVLTCWADAGLDLERPYLNPGAQDVYEALRSPVRSKAASASSADTSKQLNRSLASRSRLKSARSWRGKRFGAATAAPGSVPRCSDRASHVRDFTPRRLFRDRRRGSVPRRSVAGGAHRGGPRGRARCDPQALAAVHGLRETNLLGLYTGALGVCWAAVGAAIMLEESGLVDEAAIRLRLCQDRERGKAEGEWDLLAGQAGAILGLLWLRRHLGDHSLLEWATRLGEALIAAGKRGRTRSLSWRGHRGGGRHAVTGYSHGVAGAGIALLELGAVVRDEAYRGRLGGLRI